MEPMVQKYIYVWFRTMYREEEESVNRNGTNSPKIYIYVSKEEGEKKSNIFHRVSFLNNYHKNYVQCVNRNGINGPKIYICIEGE